MEKEEEVVVLTRREERLRLVKTVCMVSLWINMGYSSSIINPTIIDLKDLVHSNYEEISRVLVAKSVGIMVGSVIAGVLADRFPRHIDLLLSIELAILGATLAAAPWMPDLVLLGLLFVVAGLGHGGLSANGNVLCLRMWGDKSAGPLHALHMGYGIGTLVAPLVAVHFLSTNQEPHNITSNNNRPYTMIERKTVHDNLNVTFNEISNEAWTSSEVFNNVTNMTKSHIDIPYGIGGGFAGITSLIFFIFYISTSLPVVNKSKQQGSKSILQLFNPANCSGGQTGYGIFIMVCIFLIYVGNVGKDMSFCTFLFPLAVESHLHFDKTIASYIVTAYFGGYTFGRLIASILTNFVPITPMVYFEILANFGVIIWMGISNLGTQPQFWIMATAFGFFTGPIYPGCIAWMEKNLQEVTSLAIAVLDLGVGVGTLVFPWVSGYLFQYKNQMDVVYVSGGCCAFLLFVLIVAQVGVKINNQRAKDEVPSEEPQIEEDEDSTVNEGTPLIN